MQTRGVTVLVGAIIIAVLTFAVMAAPVPYVVLNPGPTWDTLGESGDGPVIEITGTEVSESSGQLRLTTVRVQPDVNLLSAVRAWFDGEEAVVPEEMIYPPGQTPEEIEQQNAEQFSRSQTAAEIAALRHLGYPVRVVVLEAMDGTPADGVFEAGDVITAVDGVEVEDRVDLQERVAGRPAGTTLTIDYLRDDQPRTAEVTTAADEEDGTPRVGVMITHEMDVPFELDIELDRIGGPSAGLMFALGIIDRLEPEDLTGGRVIAGTGSIDEAGMVGAIGGVPQKLVAARDVGATAFLVPSDNCAEAVANAQPDLSLIRVDTLEGALAGLAALRDGEEPETCG